MKSLKRSKTGSPLCFDKKFRLKFGCCLLCLCFLYAISINSVSACDRTDADTLYDWAEVNLQEFFAPSGMESFEVESFWVRHYPATSSYVGCSEGVVYVYGDIFGGLLQVDTLNNLLMVLNLSPSSSTFPPTFKNAFGMTFNLIPAGIFMMGSPEDELGRVSTETLHEVTLTEPFYMMTTEVTQGQWKAVMGDNPSYFADCGDDCPVEDVSWYMAQDFVETLNGLSDNTYALPTEAQWEYAARAGTVTAFYSGDITQDYDVDPNLEVIGWYTENSDMETHPVAYKEPNAWGLYDMSGNVSEWVSDWYGAYESEGEVDPQGPAEGEKRVRRGGSWIDYAKDCRSAKRINDPTTRDSYIGFRVALVVEDTPPVSEEDASSPSEPSDPGTEVPPIKGTFTNSLGMTFSLLPAGTFTMGSPASERGKDDDETQYQVTLTEDFYMMTTEVTQGQWKAVMGDNPSVFPDCGVDCPVDRTGWNDVQDFIAKLNAMGEGVYALPTEAQWEYAARAGSSEAFGNGDITEEFLEDPNLDLIGWYIENSQSQTHPVALKEANFWGLYDMHGNVWEWVQDYYDEYPESPVIDPTGPDFVSEEIRVRRGGSYHDYPGTLRSANRDYMWQHGGGAMCSQVGFRLIRLP